MRERRSNCLSGSVIKERIVVPIEPAFGFKNKSRVERHNLNAPITRV